MAAVDVTIDVMQRENTPKRSAERGKQLRDALEELKKRFAFIGDVRGMGLMQGIEFVEDRKTKEPSPKKTTAFLEAAKRQGLLIGKGGLYGNVIRIAPSMLISKADIDDGCKRMERALAEVK
jgi:4-aminobutyrate aminotransferase-like enzyme